MKKYYGYCLLAVLLNSGACLASTAFNPTVTVKVDLADAVRQVDGLLGQGEDRITSEKIASGLAKEVVGGILNGIEQGTSGDQVSNSTSNVAEGLVSGLLNGIEKGTSGDQVGNSTRNVLGNLSKEASRGLSEALEDKELGDNLERAGKSWSKMVGRGAKGTRRGLEDNVFPEIEAGFRGLVGTVMNWRNAAQFGSISAVSIALPVTGYYGCRVFWNVLEKRLTDPKPEIIVKHAHPKFGRWDRVSRWWNGYKTPPMIFDQAVKERLTQIEEKTRIIRDLIYQGRKMTYDNLLLYGKPGTGKTLFAQILADKTNMDFLPVTAASLLQSGVEGIKYVNELVELANRSKYGVIIFVDEADALFVDRNNLSPDSDHYKVLNHILALTGSGSNKFMLVAATNHAYVMDEAMGRRFQDRVLMPLPDATTRKELLDLYCTATVFNEKENTQDFVADAKRLFNTNTLDQIVRQTEGLSHAEIKDMVATINKSSQISGITAKLIKDTVDQAVEKHRVLEEEKAKREERAAKQE